MTLYCKYKEGTKFINRNLPNIFLGSRFTTMPFYSSLHLFSSRFRWIISFSKLCFVYFCFLIFLFLSHGKKFPVIKCRKSLYLSKSLLFYFSRKKKNSLDSCLITWFVKLSVTFDSNINILYPLYVC